MNAYTKPAGAILSFENYDLMAVMIDGEPWVTTTRLVIPLGFKSPSGLMNLLARHANEFTAEETRLVSLPTETRGVQSMRVFSLRGMRLLAMLVNSPIGARFRKWLTDLLEGRVLRRGMMLTQTRDGVADLSLDAKLALSYALELIEGLDGAEDASAKLSGILAGRYMLPSDPRLSAHAEAWERGRHLQSLASAEYARIRRMAMLDGFSETAIKAEVNRRRRLAQKQREMTFDGGDEPAEDEAAVAGDGAEAGGDPEA
jgi:prophage antirepressor-like protein